MSEINYACRYISAVLFYVIALFSQLVSAGDLMKSVSVEKAWAPQLPPTIKMMAGYFDITNKGDESIVVTGATSPAYESIEIHQSMVKDGTASMRTIKHLLISPDEQITFGPGGLHLMMKNRRAQFTHATEVAIRLHLSDGGLVTFTMPIVQGLTVHVANKAINQQLMHSHHDM